MTTERWKEYDPERIRLGLRRYSGAWWACFKHLAISPWFHAETTNLFARGTLALQDEISYQSQAIPARAATELFPSISDIEIQVGRLFPDEGSSISFREMVLLCSIVRSEKAHTVFEIGTSLGVTAFNVALNLPEDGVIYTLDLPVIENDQTSVELAYKVSISDRKIIYANRRLRRFLDSGAEGRVIQLYGDSAKFDYSPYEKRCDIVFVDGAHSEAYVKSDTQAAFELIKPGGLVLWHDYTDGFFWPDVHRQLNRLAHQHSICRISGTMFAVWRAPSLIGQ